MLDKMPSGRVESIWTLNNGCAPIAGMYANADETRSFTLAQVAVCQASEILCRDTLSKQY